MSSQLPPVARPKLTIKMVSTRKTRSAVKSCSACLELKPASDFPVFVTKCCEHENNTICDDCMATWITTSLKSQYQTQILCPEVGCDSELLRADVSRLASRKEVMRYNYICNRITLGMIPELRWCLNPTCNAPLKEWLPAGKKEYEGITGCDSCNARLCGDCFRPEHLFECEEWREDTGSEALTQALIEKTKEEGRMKCCPNCTVLISLDMPFGTIRCSRCGHSFAWDKASSSIAEAQRRRSSKPIVRFVVEEKDKAEGEVKEMPDEAMAIDTLDEESQQVMRPQKRKWQAGDEGEDPFLANLRIPRVVER